MLVRGVGGGSSVALLRIGWAGRRHSDGVLGLIWVLLDYRLPQFEGYRILDSCMRQDEYRELCFLFWVNQILWHGKGDVGCHFAYSSLG